MRSKLFCMRKRNTAKKTRRKTTSLTPGMLALPSMRWDIWMSLMVNTRESTPQPIGSTATDHMPRTTSYTDTSPDVPSMLWKPAPRIPS